MYNAKKISAQASYTCFNIIFGMSKTAHFTKFFILLKQWMIMKSENVTYNVACFHYENIGNVKFFKFYFKNFILFFYCNEEFVQIWQNVTVYAKWSFIYNFFRWTFRLNLSPVLGVYKLGVTSNYSLRIVFI